jgi:hypothetical protein
MENKLLGAKKDKFGLYEASLASLLFIIYNFIFVLGYKLLPVSFKNNEILTYVVMFLIEFLLFSL